HDLLPLLPETSLSRPPVPAGPGGGGGRRPALPGPVRPGRRGGLGDVVVRRSLDRRDRPREGCLTRAARARSSPRAYACRWGVLVPLETPARAGQNSADWRARRAL